MGTEPIEYVMREPTKVEQLKVHLENAIDNVKSIQSEIDKIKDLTEISLWDLHNSIESLYRIEINNTQYENILGGDGRSQPYSETKGGIVIDIIIEEGFYLPSRFEQNLIDYVVLINREENVQFDKVRLKP